MGFFLKKNLFCLFILKVKSVKVKPGKGCHNGCGIDGELLRVNGEVLCSLLPDQCRLLGLPSHWRFARCIELWSLRYSSLYLSSQNGEEFVIVFLDPSALNFWPNISPLYVSICSSICGIPAVCFMPCSSSVSFSGFMDFAPDVDFIGFVLDMRGVPSLWMSISLSLSLLSRCFLNLCLWLLSATLCLLLSSSLSHTMDDVQVELS